MPHHPLNRGGIKEICIVLEIAKKLTAAFTHLKDNFKLPFLLMD